MLNIGSGNYIDGYFGNRYSSGYSGGYSSYGGSYGNRVASSANLTRVSRDLSQGYGQDIDIMSENFDEGNTTQALKLYRELFENAKDTAQDYGYELTDSQIRSSIDKAFQARTGVKLSDQASAHAKTSFMTGLLEGIPIFGWFGANANSKADARATVQGRKVGGLETAKEIAGATVSSAAGIVGLGLAQSAIAGLEGTAAATALSATGIAGLSSACSSVLGAAGIGAAGLGLGILPILGVAALVGTAVVLGKQYLANKAS